ncbi:GNAT family N-acetyltransferase [Paracoccus zhejiangensis]|uniref:N-acetyltransferase n=1 Tax=Paracoccus zhejiangensis TaxID=1077935 RepID=A0A2H5EYW5_9RHOB|nr:GNAT family N-acetyltransferase [Paracoccus zhejiangensis]AUH64485.1 N-acetyltransferase [Paracoccus zhejiangensis]
MTQLAPGLDLQIIDAGRGDPGLEAVIGEIFALFAGREREFGVNPDVVIDYPDLECSDFLADPAAYLTRRQTEVEADRGAPLARIVMLTTYRDRIGAALTDAGFILTPIDMGAGPLGTAFLTRDLGAEGPVLYVEAVNEADPRISPSFALRLTDAAGRLVGGACGSVQREGGVARAYLAIMAVAPDQPAGTGTALAQAMTHHLTQMGVTQINLGTQTADRFYEKLGFRQQHVVQPKLRFREGVEGKRVWHDLVMMQRDL